MYNSLRTLKLSLLHIGFVQLDQRWQYDRIVSPFSRLYLITDGEGWVFHNNQKFALKTGYLYLIPSFTYSRYHCDQFLEQYYIHVLDEMEAGLSVYETESFVYERKANELDYALFARLLALNPGRRIEKPDPKTYDNRAELLSFNLPKSTLTKNDYVESLGILLQVFSHFFAADRERQIPRDQSFHQMASVLRYVNQHLSEKLTVEALAAANHLNADYFSRLFLRLVGVRPIDYINNKRLERAQLLLTTSNTSIKEIAGMVGIPNIYYFSRLFKQKLNTTPARYRATNWQV